MLVFGRNTLETIGAAGEQMYRESRVQTDQEEKIYNYNNKHKVRMLHVRSRYSTSLAKIQRISAVAEIIKGTLYSSFDITFQ